MRPIYITMLATVLHLLASGQNAALPVEEVHNKTLKGGYIISFLEDDQLQYLYLSKDGKRIKELSSASKGLPRKNLGYVGADFQYFFVPVHSFGSGNPHYIELIRKIDGKNILSSGAAWIDADEKKELLLYCETDVPGIGDKMTLVDISTGKKLYLRFPSDIFDEPEVLRRIEISSATKKELVIKYTTMGGSKTKKYYR